MWEDIKRWIIFLYFTTGMLFGVYTLSITENQVQGFKAVIYIAICAFAWLPVAIVAILEKFI